MKNVHLSKTHLAGGGCGKGLQGREKHRACLLSPGGQRQAC